MQKSDRELLKKYRQIRGNEQNILFATTNGANAGNYIQASLKTPIAGRNTMRARAIGAVPPGECVLIKNGNDWEAVSPNSPNLTQEYQYINRRTRPSETQEPVLAFVLENARFFERKYVYWFKYDNQRFKAIAEVPYDAANNTQQIRKFTPSLTHFLVNRNTTVFNILQLVDYFSVNPRRLIKSEQTNQVIVYSRNSEIFNQKYTVQSTDYIINPGQITETFNYSYTSLPENLKPYAYRYDDNERQTYPILYEIDLDLEFGSGNIDKYNPKTTTTGFLGTPSYLIANSISMSRVPFRSLFAATEHTLSKITFTNGFNYSSSSPVTIRRSANLTDVGIDPLQVISSGPGSGMKVGDFVSNPPNTFAQYTNSILFGTFPSSDNRYTALATRAFI